MSDRTPSDIGPYVLDLARRSGAGDALVHVKKTRYTTLDYRGSGIEKFEDNLEQSIRMNIYVDGRYSEHTSSNLDPDSLRQFVQDSVDLTRCSDPNPCRALPEARDVAMKDARALGVFDQTNQNFSLEKRVSICRSLLDQCRLKKSVIDSMASTGQMQTAESLFASNGLEAHLEKTVFANFASMTVEGKSARKANGGLGMYATQLDDILDGDRLVDPLYRRLSSESNAERMTPGQAFLVMDPWTSHLIVKQILRGALDSQIQQDRSFLCGRLEEQIASPILSLQDDPHLPGASGSRLWDSEGLFSQPTPIIEEGRLVHYFLGDHLGRKLQLKPSTATPSNSIVSPGKRSFEEIVNDLASGVAVHASHGGNMDVTSGDFSFVFSGCRIRDGAIAEPLKEIMVTGNILELLRRLVEVGNDPWAYAQDNIRCPTLVFENVSFS